MAVVFVFPGQGSQLPGMGKDLYEAFSEARDVYSEAKKITGIDWAQISFEADKTTLSQTENTQPCLFLNSAAVLRILGSITRYEAVAGHSLGEYSALYAAKVLKFGDALNAVVHRGKIMSQAESGGMLAPLGADDDKVREVVSGLKKSGDIVIANRNAPGQMIVSSQESLLEIAAEKLKTEAGAKKVIRLPVSAAFHSPLMEDAKNEMTKILDKIEFNEPKVAFYANATGTRLENPGEIRTALINQITSPVLWIDQVKAIAADGFDQFVEIGPGKVLQSLISRIIPGADVRGISNAETIKSEIGLK